MKKCDSFCEAKFPNLRLRNNVFYFIMELPRVNGKRRYKRTSLHTNNFYEARERIKRMTITNGLRYQFNEIRVLLDDLIYEKPKGPSGSYATLSNGKVLSKRNNPETLNNLILLGGMAELTKDASPVELAVLNELRALRLEVAEIKKSVLYSTVKPQQLHAEYQKFWI